MPPRIPLTQCLRATQTTPSITVRQFTTTPAPAATSTITQRRRKHDPYAIAQAKARKAANLSRQQVLKKERTASLGDPVKGTETAFLRSFDTATPLKDNEHSLKTHLRVANGTPLEQDDEGGKRNFFLSADELRDTVEHSKQLSTPPADILDQDEYALSSTPEDRRQRLTEQQATAEEALRRIASLSLGNSEDRLKVNTQRCISTFGRHHTDNVLTRVTDPTTTIAVADAAKEEAGEHVLPRIGKDTGSSEVQIAILTAKIRAVTAFLETRGTTDKMNKRNLRLLVHRRQKLLQYLRRKDRGGRCLCIAILGLATHSIILNDQIQPPESLNVQGTAMGMLMWPGAGGVVDFLLFLFVLVAGERRRFKTLRARQIHDHGFLFVGCFITFRPLVVLIYEFVAYHQATKYLPGSNETGTLTTETWACGAGSEAATLCHELRTTRWLLVPILGLASMLTGTAIWVWLHRKEERKMVLGHEDLTHSAEPSVEAKSTV
ncbi:hypothetical protein LTR15_009746 [Elasticomyces elasticus]|nr:hypothetical protein LTR15_009746 [Elasticomyces elasticus]